jgi:hypothetical protein
MNEGGDRGNKTEGKRGGGRVQGSDANARQSTSLASLGPLAVSFGQPGGGETVTGQCGIPHTAPFTSPAAL